MRKTRGAGERQGGGNLSPIFPAATAPFPKSCASYFRFARFNTFPLYYLRAWHRLPPGLKKRERERERARTKYVMVGRVGRSSTFRRREMLGCKFTILCTVFRRKGTPFVYLLLKNGKPSTDLLNKNK